MICGNTAALRIEEARQDRLARQAPTQDELDRYVDEWLYKKARKMGSQFLTEAFCEAKDYGRIFKAWVEGDNLELGFSLDKLVRDYWTPFALEASESVNFNEYR